MNITEAHDVALVLQHMTGATNAERKAHDVIAAAERLAMRCGRALDVTPWKIATPAEIYDAVRDLAQRQADSLNYQTDYADAP